MCVDGGGRAGCPPVEAELLVDVRDVPLNGTDAQD
jgi:hypothetical protein